MVTVRSLEMLRDVVGTSESQGAGVMAWWDADVLNFAIDDTNARDVAPGHHAHE